MRIAWMAGALACALAMPAAAQHAKPSEAELKDAFVLHIADNGLLLLPSKELLTIDDLYKRIAKAGHEFEKRDGEGQQERIDLPVVLQVEANVPWQHVQIALEVVARWRCHRVWLAMKRGDEAEVAYRNVWFRGDMSSVFVVTKGGLVQFPVPRFPLFLVSKSPRTRTWKTEDGTFELPQPTEAAYLFGPDENVGTLSEARAVASAAAAKARVQNAVQPMRGIVSAPPQMPCRLVFEALGIFDRSLFPHVEILGTAIPPSEQWDRHQLPFPPLAFPQGSVASAIGGDPEEKIVVSPWVIASGSTPTASKEVQAIPGFDLIDKNVRLPLAAGLASDKGPWGDARIAVNLTRRGELRANGHQFSLRSLGVFLRGIVTASKLNPKAARLRLLLRVDGDAPWGHVQTLMTEVKRSGIQHVEFGVRVAATAGDTRRTAERFDVLHRSKEPDGQQHDAFFRLTLFDLAGASEARGLIGGFRTVERSELNMQAEREVETEWGPEGATQRVRRPLNVRFDWNGRQYYSIREVIRTVVAARAAGIGGGNLWSKKKLRVVVSASEKVPAKYVIACLARLSAMKWGEIWFFRRTDVTDDAREAAFLPYPERDRPLRVLDGLEKTGAAGDRRGK